MTFESNLIPKCSDDYIKFKSEEETSSLMEYKLSAIQTNLGFTALSIPTNHNTGISNLHVQAPFWTTNHVPTI